MILFILFGVPTAVVSSPPMSVPRALTSSPAGAERPGVSARRRAVVGDGRDDGEPGGAALVDDARSRRESTSASGS